MEYRLTMPCNSKEASELEARMLREAKDVYEDVFGPQKNEGGGPLEPDLNKLREQLKAEKSD